jgi:hypothetical protein
MATDKRNIFAFFIFETKSVVKMQRRHRTQYGKDPSSDKANRRWLKKLQEIAIVLHRTEAQNCCCSRNSYTANIGEHLEGN